MRDKKVTIESLQKLTDEEQLKFQDKLFRKLITGNLIKAVVLFLLLFLAMFLKTKVNRLAIIAPIYYIVFLIGGILFMGSICSFFIYYKRVNNGRNIACSLHKKHSMYDFASFVIMTLSCLYFATMFIVTPATVEQSSMSDTYNEGDRILVWHLFVNAKRGDVVVINCDEKFYSAYAGNFLIKRIVAKENDRIEYRDDGHIYINDKDEGWITYARFLSCLTNKATGETYLSNEDTRVGYVPSGYYIAFGDNRSGSLDSRDLGLIPNENILGISFFRIFPFDKFGIPKADIG